MDQLRQQVIATERKISDLLDKPDDPAASRLRTEMRGLEDDLQSKKNPVSIEDRVKRIISLLDGEAKQRQIMNAEHLDMFKDYFNNLREILRRTG